MLVYYIMSLVSQSVSTYSTHHQKYYVSNKENIWSKKKVKRAENPEQYRLYMKNLMRERSYRNPDNILKDLGKLWETPDTLGKTDFWNGNI